MGVLIGLKEDRSKITTEALGSAVSVYFGISSEFNHVRDHKCTP